MGRGLGGNLKWGVKASGDNSHMTAGKSFLSAEFKASCIIFQAISCSECLCWEGLLEALKTTQISTVTKDRGR
jgi:hypothetical protein